jgi:hypothetical protein
MLPGRNPRPRHDIDARVGFGICIVEYVGIIPKGGFKQPIVVLLVHCALTLRRAFFKLAMGSVPTLNEMRLLALMLTCVQGSNGWLQLCVKPETTLTPSVGTLNVISVTSALGGTRFNFFSTGNRRLISQSHPTAW